MIGVIADDLSGAAELGAVGLRHGLRAEIILGGVPSANADLVCYDTDSRSCEPVEAGARVRAAAKVLNAAGARWIYKKVDSVLRGPVTAEVEALMEALGLEVALVVAANPALGRVVREGKYYVRGRLIHETEFARDPEHPRKSSVVREMVGKASSPLHVCGPHDPLPASGIVLGEAASAEDVEVWAGRATPGMLVAGAAEFFGALLEANKRMSTLARSQNRAEAAPHPASGHPLPIGWGEGRGEGHFPAPDTGAGVRELFVCGSTSESSREFVRAARDSGVPVVSLPRELAGGAAFTDDQARALAEQAVVPLRAQGRVILDIALPPVREHTVAKQLAIHLVRTASFVINQSDATHVYVEGGATAAALMRQMRWSRLAVLGELAPGVAVLGVGPARSLRLIIKPGSYVWPDALAGKPPARAG